MNDDLTILRWIQDARGLYSKSNPPVFTGMCLALAYAFKNHPEITHGVGRIILNRFGIYTLNSILEHGTLGDNLYILQALIPEFNFLQMEGDIPRMQKILGVISMPPEDFMQWVEEKPLIVANNYWWDAHDREIRLKAFDKLISLYSAKISSLDDL